MATTSSKLDVRYVKIHANRYRVAPADAFQTTTYGYLDRVTGGWQARTATQHGEPPRTLGEGRTRDDAARLLLDEHADRPRPDLPAGTFIGEPTPEPERELSVRVREIDGVPAVLCAWTIGCDRPATLAASHAVLGMVPVCAMHDDFFGLGAQRAEFVVEA